jgi:hypothetical protein
MGTAKFTTDPLLQVQGAVAALRTVSHPDRRPEVDPYTARSIAIAVGRTEPLCKSMAHNGRIIYATLSVRPYVLPNGPDERWALMLLGPGGQNVIMDAAAKRHVMNAYRVLAWHAENTHERTVRAPHAWDITDIPDLPTNTQEL